MIELAVYKQLNYNYDCELIRKISRKRNKYDIRTATEIHLFSQFCADKFFVIQLYYITEHICLIYIVILKTSGILSTLKQNV